MSYTTCAKREFLLLPACQSRQRRSNKIRCEAYTVFRADLVHALLGGVHPGCFARVECREAGLDSLEYLLFGVEL